MKIQTFLYRIRLKNSDKPHHCHLHLLHPHHSPQTLTSQTQLRPLLHWHLQPDSTKKPSKPIIHWLHRSTTKQTNKQSIIYIRNYLLLVIGFHVLLIVNLPFLCLSYKWCLLLKLIVFFNSKPLIV